MKTTSKKKIEANKANAQFSTGPKTALGKTKTKHNALKHGFYATSSLLPGEDKALYDAIKDEQNRIFSPKTFIEKALVDQLVSELWNLRRVARAEQLHVLDSQRGLKEEPLLRLTESEKNFMERAQSLEDNNASAEDWEMLEKLKKKAAKTYLDVTYESLFVYDPDGRMQRLTQMKRHALQTVLSIERELEARPHRKKQG